VALKAARCASRRVTVLLCDVSGYTALAERLDPEQVFGLIEPALGVVLDAVHRHGGSVNQFLGDGAMALFDEPAEAIHAALDLLHDLHAVAADARQRHGVSFEMRVGLHTGVVAIGAIGSDLRVDYTARGATARVAAGLLSIARPGEIVVTEVTRRLAAADVMFEPRGETADADGEPVPVYTVVADERAAVLGWRYESVEPVDVPDALYA
jgi:class 3 adenylate cyclase